MKFKLNGLEWLIKEASQEDIKYIIRGRAEKGLEEQPETGRYFGTTLHDDLIIYLDEDLPKERKKKTLIHELTHCYIGTNITHINKNYCEEEVCDIASNAYDFINKIIKQYFKEEE